MTADIKLDPKTHDLPADIVMTTGQNRIRQEIEVLLMTFRGGWFLDLGFGIPYFEYILIKGPRRAQVESILRAKIKEVPGVLRIPALDIKIDPATRYAIIECNGIETESGDVNVRYQWRE